MTAGTSRATPTKRRRLPSPRCGAAWPPPVVAGLFHPHAQREGAASTAPPRSAENSSDMDSDSDQASAKSVVIVVAVVLAVVPVLLGVPAMLVLIPPLMMFAPAALTRFV